MLLLDKYEVHVPSALMPLAKWRKPDGTIWIVGISPSPPYSEYLWDKLLVELARIHQADEMKTWSVESRTTKGTFYTVTRIKSRGDVHYGCTCPARSECWHIKMIKEINYHEARIQREGQKATSPVSK